MHLLPGRMRYWFCTTPTDMRKSFDGLSGLVRNHLSQDPLTGEMHPGAPITSIEVDHDHSVPAALLTAEERMIIERGAMVMDPTRVKYNVVAVAAPLLFDDTDLEYLPHAATVICNPPGLADAVISHELTLSDDKATPDASKPEGVHDGSEAEQSEINPKNAQILTIQDTTPIGTKTNHENHPEIVP